MKRCLCLLLAVLICASACSCSRKYVVAEEDMVNPAKFYYCTADTEDVGSYSNELGFLRWEVRDLRLQSPAPEHILTQYLDGPKTEGLVSPFPKGLGVESVTLEQGLLTIEFNDVFYELRGAALTTAAACIVYTMTQFEGIEFVCLETPQTMLSGLMSVPLEPSDFVFHDDYTTSDQTEIRLYFPNQSGRYLREESRRETITDDSGLPVFILRQLLEGPQSATASATFPAGTELLDVQITDGLCSINLNEAFSNHAPQDSMTARLQLLAIVNSLTELETVQYVRFLCNGQTMTKYGPLSLPSYYEREEAAIEPLEPSLEYDVTFCLSYQRGGQLIRVPYAVRRSGSKTAEESVLNELFAYETKNGCTNIFPEGAAATEVELIHNICRVTLNSAFDGYQDGTTQQELAIRSIVATLCEMDSVDRVEIIYSEDAGSSISASRIHTPQEDWFLP